MPQVYPDFSAGFANLGTAMFGDPKVIAQSRAAAAEEAYRQGMLANAQRELDLKAPVYDAQRKQALASAGYDSVRTKKENQEVDAANALRDIFTSGLTQDPATGQAVFNIGQAGVALGQALASDPTGQRAKSLGEAIGKLQATLINQNSNATEDQRRQAAALMGGLPSANTAFTVGQSDRLAQQDLAARVAVQREANNGDLYKPVIVPGGSSVFPIPNDPRFPSADLASVVAPQASPQAQQQSIPQTASPAMQSAIPAPQAAPYRDPATGAIIVPDKKSFASVPSNPYAPYSPDPALERSAYNAWLKDNHGANHASTLASLNMLERFADGKGNDPYQGYGGQLLSFVPSFIGGNPASQQFRQQASILASRARAEPGAVSNYEQQLFLQRVPNLSNSREANAAMIQVGKIGAQKAVETDIWMQRFIASGGSLAQAQSIANEYNSDPRNFGASENPDGTVNLNPNYPKIDQWYQEKLSGFQSPQTQQAQPTSLSGVVAPNAEPVPAGIDQNIWNHMTPQEKALFKQ